MDEHFTIPLRRPTIQAAEGLPRWRWTVAEIERLAAEGIFSDDNKFELLGGEIVPMSPYPFTASNRAGGDVHHQRQQCHVEDE